MAELIGNVKVNPTIEVTTLTISDTEYSYQLPAFTTRFTIHGSDELKVAVISGSSGSTFVTVRATEPWTEDLKGALTGMTLYFQSTVPSATARVISWQT